MAADCTDLVAVERMREQTEVELGSVGIVAAFAGGGRARPGPLAQTSEEEWHSTVDANLTATFLTLKSFLPGMIECGGGSIVTMASSGARFPTGAPAPYAPAKAGVIVLTSQVANEVGSHNVRVNCLAPHTILVERTRRFMPEEHQRLIDPAEAAGDPRGRGAGHPLSGLRELLLDHGRNARRGGRQGHGLKGGSRETKRIKFARRPLTVAHDYRRTMFGAAGIIGHYRQPQGGNTC